MNWARKSSLLSACIALCSITGCIGTNPFVVNDDAPLHGDVRQVVATWNNEIVLSPDPCHNGKLAPGIAGRVYLFGADVGFPRAGDGTLTVDLYDTSRQDAAGQPVMMERWEFDPVTLSRLMRRDMIGWGYSLFLPWGTFRPEVHTWNVLIKLSYQPPNGVPLFTENPLSLTRPGGNNVRRTVHQVSGAPAASQAGAQNPTAARPMLWPPEPLRTQPTSPTNGNRASR